MFILSNIRDQTPITQQDLPKLEKYDTLEFWLWISVTYLFVLCL